MLLKKINPLRNLSTSKSWDIDRSYNPVNWLSRDINNILNNAFGGMDREAQYFIPAVDVIEKDKEFLITLDIPGVEQKDVNIELENNDLVISGKKETFMEEEQEDLYHSERSFGAFKRLITLPDNIKKESISANFKNGVVIINIEKEETKEAKKKVIKIN
jgi:HSP20 family protein